VSTTPPSESELSIPEMRLARLSVLQELTAAALELANPSASVDDFLQHVSERLGCVAVLWLGVAEGQGGVLHASAGISRQARQLEIESGPGGLAGLILPYPELMAADLERWELPLHHIDQRTQCLCLYFSRLSQRPPREFDAMARRVAEVFQSAIAHRSLYLDLQRSYNELERAQQALVVRERLAALGEMAAAVAHEVRNPLGAIFNSLATLKKVVPSTPESAGRLLDIVEEEASRLNRIVTDLLDFAKPGGVRLQESSIDEVLMATVEAAHAARFVPSDVSLEVRIDDDLPMVNLDGRLLRQALLNLVANAVQMTTAPGMVVAHAFARGHGADRELCIAVTDEGPGIEPEARERLFEPFFTTKSSGTGLGLAIVKRVVEAHQGRVEVTSRRTGGAVFTVVLPVC